MLTIRSEQMAALEAAAWGDFVDRLTRTASSLDPSLGPADGLRGRASAAARVAEQWGFESEYDVARVSLALLATGWESPVAAARLAVTMGDARKSTERRIALLRRMAAEALG